MTDSSTSSPELAVSGCTSTFVFSSKTFLMAGSAASTNGTSSEDSTLGSSTSRFLTGVGAVKPIPTKLTNARAEKLPARFLRVASFPSTFLVTPGNKVGFTKPTGRAKSEISSTSAKKLAMRIN
ncbi:MAG: hypothetical protein WC777_02580 [Candidatus Gracilibacteria bacterium]